MILIVMATIVINMITSITLMVTNMMAVMEVMVEGTEETTAPSDTE
jgi:hypothetical protein